MSVDDVRTKLRIGLVGCGRISEKHIEAILECKKDIELTAICEIDATKLESMKERLNVPGYSCLQDMINAEQLELIALCTPSGLHAEQTILAAKNGIHVITEKPMATRWKDGIRMVRECDLNNVKLFVVKQNRHNQTLQMLKTAVDDGLFGKIYMVQVNVFWTRPQSYYDQAKWRGTWEFDGGALMNQASHYVDLLDWLVGPVEKIQCMTSTNRQIEVEDSGVLNVKWRSGTIGSVAVTMLTYPENLEGSITIIGERGTARIGGVAVNEVQIWDFEDSESFDVKKISYDITSVYGFGHSAYYRNVIDCLLYGETAQTDGREGLKSLELIIAAYTSALEGVTVSLPLEY